MLPDTKLSQARVFTGSICRSLVGFAGCLAGLTLSVPTAIADGANNSNLDVRIDGLRNLQGQVCLSLHNRAQGFPSDPDSAISSRCAPIDGNSVTVSFEHLAIGNYAVALFHDENGNGQVDTNRLGIPREGFGFSNNPPIRPRPARFEEAAVLVGGRQTTIQIQMRYL